MSWKTQANKCDRVEIIRDELNKSVAIDAQKGNESETSKILKKRQIATRKKATESEPRNEEKKEDEIW